MTNKAKLIEKLRRGSINAKEARQALTIFGFKLHRTKGSHERWIHQDGRAYTLATHRKDIKYYHVRNIKKLLLGE